MKSGLLLMMAAATLCAQPFTTAVRGAKNVFLGSDAYVRVITTFTGQGVRIYINSISSPDAEVSVSCQNTLIACFTDANQRTYVYAQATQKQTFFTLKIRPRTLGAHTILLELEAAGEKVPFEYKLNAMPIPEAPQARKAKEPYEPFPKWKSTMITLADKWCKTGREVMVFGDESQPWYYDGGRVYFQIADYLGGNAWWQACGMNIVRQYRDYVLMESERSQAGVCSLMGWQWPITVLAMRCINKLYC